MTEIWINRKCHLQKKSNTNSSKGLKGQQMLKWLITVVCCNLGLNATTMKLIFSKRNDTLYHYKRKKSEQLGSLLFQTDLFRLPKGLYQKFTQ